MKIVLRTVPTLMIAVAGVFALVGSCAAFESEPEAKEAPATEVSATEGTETAAPAEHAHPTEGHAPADAAGHDPHGEAPGEHPHDPAEHHPEGGGDHGHAEHEYTIWGDLSLWSFVAFIGFCFAINKLGLWNLLVTTMADRERAAWEKLDTADQQLAEAETALRKFRGRFEALDDTIKETLAEGERDMAYAQGQIAKNAEKEAAGLVERARHEVERVRDQALNALFESMADKVIASTEAALREKVQSSDEDRLIDATLGQFSK